MSTYKYGDVVRLINSTVDYVVVSTGNLHQGYDRMYVTCYRRDVLTVGIDYKENSGLPLQFCMEYLPQEEEKMLNILRKQGFSLGRSDTDRIIGADFGMHRQRVMGMTPDKFNMKFNR